MLLYQQKNKPNIKVQNKSPKKVSQVLIALDKTENTANTCSSIVTSSTGCVSNTKYVQIYNALSSNIQYPKIYNAAIKQQIRNATKYQIRCQAAKFHQISNSVASRDQIFWTSDHNGRNVL